MVSSPAHTLTIKGGSGAGKVTAGGETENSHLGGVDTEVLGVDDGHTGWRAGRH